MGADFMLMSSEFERKIIYAWVKRKTFEDLTASDGSLEIIIINLHISIIKCDLSVVKNTVFRVKLSVDERLEIWEKVSFFIASDEALCIITYLPILNPHK